MGTGRDVAATTSKELIKARIFQQSQGKICISLQIFENLGSLHGKTVALRKFSRENLYRYSDTCPVPCLQFWSFFIVLGFLGCRDVLDQLVVSCVLLAIFLHAVLGMVLCKLGAPLQSC